MEVGSDLSTKRPLLDDDSEATPSIEASENAPISRFSQQSWRFGGSRRQRANYGRLEGPDTSSAVEDSPMGEDGDERGAEMELLGRIEDFYECEEDEVGAEQGLLTSNFASEESIKELRASSPEQQVPRNDPSLVASNIEFQAAPINDASSSSSSTSRPVMAVSAVDVRDLRLQFLANRRSNSSADEEDPENVEMHSLVRIDSPRMSPQATGGVLTSPTSNSALPSARGRAPSTIERYCFICLDDDKDQPLTSCCTTCFAAVHVGCWREWRNNQRITALRSRLLGLRMQTNHLLRCTICKSGTAVVAGEEDGLEWMNELLCGSGDGDEGGRVIGTQGQMRRDDSDEDNDPQLEDLVDMRTCLALVVYLGVLLLVLLISCVLIVMQRFYAGDVILSCIIILYELSVLQIVALAIARRRGILAATSGPQRGSGNPAANVDLERGGETVS